MSSPWRKTWWCLALIAGLYAFYWITYAYAHDWNQRWLRGEDRFIEWVTFAGFFGGSVVLLRALPLATGRFARLYLAGLALFLFVCAGEEVSWGQRLLGFDTPEAIAEKNEQKEFNLHNLSLPISPLGIVAFILTVLGIVAPLAAWNRWPRWVPALPVVPIFLVAEMVDQLPRFLKPPLDRAFGPVVALEFGLDSAEFKEMVWGIGCLLVALLLARAWRTSGCPKR